MKDNEEGEEMCSRKYKRRRELVKYIDQERERERERERK